jgi:hypothetical protein
MKRNTQSNGFARRNASDLAGSLRKAAYFEIPPPGND